MSDSLSLYCLILSNLITLLINVISESWFICINVHVSHGFSYLLCIIVCNISDRGVLARKQLIQCTCKEKTLKSGQNESIV